MKGIGIFLNSVSNIQTGNGENLFGESNVRTGNGEFGKISELVESMLCLPYTRRPKLLTKYCQNLIEFK